MTQKKLTAADPESWRLLYAALDSSRKEANQFQDAQVLNRSQFDAVIEAVTPQHTTWPDLRGSPEVEALMAGDDLSTNFMEGRLPRAGRS